jgi:tetratricopeptide (TPR) repeat protein
LILRASAHGLTTFGVALPLFAAVGHKINPQMELLGVVAFTLVCSAAFGAVATGVSFAAAGAAGNSFGRFTMGGSTTPYQEQYSREQALVMRGDVDEALRSFEAILLEKPDAIAPRIKAAELYVKEKGSHRRAAELFREVQRVASITPGEDVYATNRLVDLYAGPLADPGRALVELRRLIERYPDSAAAKHARIALAALKTRVHQGV